MPLLLHLPSSYGSRPTSISPSSPHPIPSTPSLYIVALPQNSLPAIALKASVLLDRLKAAYKAFTMGSFAESRQEFDFILRAVPLVVGETRAEGNELKEVCQATGIVLFRGTCAWLAGWLVLLPFCLTTSSSVCPTGE